MIASGGVIVDRVNRLDAGLKKTIKMPTSLIVKEFPNSCLALALYRVFLSFHPYRLFIIIIVGERAMQLYTGGARI